MGGGSSIDLFLAHPPQSEDGNNATRLVPLREGVTASCPHMAARRLFLAHTGGEVTAFRKFANETVATFRPPENATLEKRRQFSLAGVAIVHSGASAPSPPPSFTDYRCRPPSEEQPRKKSREEPYLASGQSATAVEASSAPSAPRVLPLSLSEDLLVTASNSGVLCVWEIVGHACAAAIVPLPLSGALNTTPPAVRHGVRDLLPAAIHREVALVSLLGDPEGRSPTLPSATDLVIEGKDDTVYGDLFLVVSGDARVRALRVGQRAGQVDVDVGHGVLDGGGLSTWQMEYTSQPSTNRAPFQVAGAARRLEDDIPRLEHLLEALEVVEPQNQSTCSATSSVLQFGGSDVQKTALKDDVLQGLKSGDAKRGVQVLLGVQSTWQGIRVLLAWSFVCAGVFSSSSSDNPPLFTGSLSAARLEGSYQARSGQRDIQLADLGHIAVPECRNFVAAVAMVPSAATSCHGLHCIVGGYDRVCRIDVVTGVRLWSAAGHSALVSAVATTGDGGLVLTGAADGSLQVFSNGGGRRLNSFPKVHPSRVVHIAVVAEDRAVLLTGGSAIAKVDLVPRPRHILAQAISADVLPSDLLQLMVAPFVDSLAT